MSTPAKVVVQPPTPPDVRQNTQAVASSSGTSSGSGSDTYVEILAPKARRARPHQRATFQVKVEKLASRVPFPIPDQDDTPRASTSVLVPKFRPAGIPRSNTEVVHVLHPRSASVTVATLGRKKSGEPLKSSLKSRRPVVRGDLSVITGALNSTKSEPSTPTHNKSVHFDSQLEHVKLFLAEQKPLAVSRDGSPTDDTSGTESDFPAFIYGNGKEEKRGKLRIDCQGPREATVEELKCIDVKLEALQLGEDGTSLSGRVRVRNLAFEKWVAVRFTFDSWQTTSEVTARYMESIGDGQFDRFQFSIKLNDMMGRIEEKTMFLAVRYSAAGRDMWDSNGGQNFRITFAWEKVKQTQKVIEEAGKAAGIADLKSKLEKVANGTNSRTTVGGFLSSRSRSSPLGANSRTPSPPPVADDDDSFTLKSKTSLSSRYDFSASLKNSWRRSQYPGDAIPAGIERPRTNTYPTTLPNFPGRPVTDKRTFLALTRGSPRILDADDANASSGIQPYYSSDKEDTPVQGAYRKSARNHQRGYFDLGVSPPASGVRRTPPGTPFDTLDDTPSGKEEYPFPRSASPREPGAGFARAASTIPVMSTVDSAQAFDQVLSVPRMWRVSSGGSEESTPSNTSNEDSSRSASPSLDGSPYEGPVSLAPDDAFPRTPSPSEDNNYSVFLNKFCFYTGSQTNLDIPSEIHRSHSASSVEEFLSSSPYLGGAYQVSPGQTPTRSSSYDDVGAISGNTTPTARSVAAGVSSSMLEPVLVSVGLAH
ncbi:hypothetical protein EW026_g6550 [Hermanssonia centrifuga]|uniref:CBM21 domain-containing protein n=1 Tax=Hermanssonia centrifuga TaxID=98765 RepID=A0A4S4KAM2_9APHY|nr:hypothetical protein EW026_g6550 [Hermanssonia centrifuga]